MGQVTIYKSEKGKKQKYLNKITGVMSDNTMKEVDKKLLGIYLNT
ncbi:hypothetical protein [Gracilibacillus halophilus]|nr:hypothetical protein [Gracilibacillus halophilus]